MALSITWEHLPDSGAPQVGVTVSGVAGTQPVTVEVSWDGGATWHGVRGARQVSVTDAAFVRDFVPPLNVPIAYRVTCSDGAQAVSPSGTVTSDTAWMQDPLAPRSAMPVHVHPRLGDGAVTLTGAALSQAVWQQPVDEVTVQGAQLPVASIGTRTRAGSIPVEFTGLAAEGGALRRLLMEAGQLVLRGVPGDLFDPVAHVVLGEVTETRYGAANVMTFAAAARQARPQSLRIVVPWFTYGDVQQIVQSALTDAAYADVLAALPAGTRYLDALRDPHVLIGG